MKMRVAIGSSLPLLSSSLCSLGWRSSLSGVDLCQQFCRWRRVKQPCLTASLKAARISSEIDLVQSACQTIATRLLIQTDYTNFYSGNWSGFPDESLAWLNSTSDLQSALSVTRLLRAAPGRLYSRNTTGNSKELLNVTARTSRTDPRSSSFRTGSPTGTRAFLGQGSMGTRHPCTQTSPTSTSTGRIPISL